MGSASTGKISGGNIARAVCDRCGLQFAYRALRIETDTSLFVCEGCLDTPDPRRRILPRSDAIALERPRPDTTLENPDNSSPPTPDVWGDNDDPDTWFENLEN